MWKCSKQAGRMMLQGQRPEEDGAKKAMAGPLQRFVP